MTEQFNRILQAFGANRVKLTEVDRDFIQFELLNYGMFCIWENGGFGEWLNDDYCETANSRWLHAISLGKKRGEEGVIQ